MEKNEIFICEIKVNVNNLGYYLRYLVKMFFALLLFIRIRLKLVIIGCQHYKTICLRFSITLFAKHIKRKQ